MTDLERVEKVIDWLIFNKKVKNRRELAKKLDYTESSLSQIINKKVPLSENFIKKLSITFNNISEEWLLTGEGEMIKDGQQTTKQETTLDLSKLISTIESQQETINRQSKIIEMLTGKI